MIEWNSYASGHEWASIENVLTLTVLPIDPSEVATPNGETWEFLVRNEDQTFLANGFAKTKAEAQEQAKAAALKCLKNAIWALENDTK